MEVLCGRMVKEEQFEPRGELEPIGRITLKPNQSLSWRALRLFLICFALLSGSIALAFLFLGYWMILPLAGAEFLIVSLCLWLCLKRSAVQEVITFSKSRIKIEKGSDVPSESYHWERFYTKLLVESSTSSLHRNRVWISHKNSKIEIGSFLTATEQERLVKSFSDLITRSDNYSTATRG